MRSEPRAVDCWRPGNPPAKLLDKNLLELEPGLTPLLPASSVRPEPEPTTPAKGAETHEETGPDAATRLANTVPCLSPGNAHPASRFSDWP
jgi:hypothetical protein